MSALAPSRGVTAAAPASRRDENRPELRVVGLGRPVVARLPFVLLVGAILAAGLLSLLLLHTLAAQDGFRLHALQKQAAALRDTEQQLALADQEDAAPTRLAQRARAQGLVPAATLAYLRLRDGRIVGVARAAAAPPPPAPTATATTTGAAHTTSKRHLGARGARRHPRHR